MSKIKKVVILIFVFAFLIISTFTVSASEITNGEFTLGDFKIYGVSFTVFRGNNEYSGETLTISNQTDYLRLRLDFNSPTNSFAKGDIIQVYFILEPNKAYLTNSNNNISVQGNIRLATGSAKFDSSFFTFGRSDSLQGYTEKANRTISDNSIDYNFNDSSINYNFNRYSCLLRFEVLDNVTTYGRYLYLYNPTVKVQTAEDFQADKITQNQDENTDKITQNQDENADKITQNQDDNTDEITKNQNNNTNKVTQNQDKNTNKITQNQDENTQQIIDNQNQLQEDEKTEANDTGDSGVNDISSVIPNDSDGFIDSIGNLVGAMSYNGTNCNWELPSVSLPKIDGVMPAIKLWDKQEIPFEYWIGKIPGNIMTLVQSLLTIALIVYCFKELYSIISYVLTLKGGGASE